jgi:hypothetical protein
LVIKSKNKHLFLSATGASGERRDGRRRKQNTVLYLGTCITADLSPVPSFLSPPLQQKTIYSHTVSGKRCQ